jgi:hypothetical protein
MNVDCMYVCIHYHLFGLDGKKEGYKELYFRTERVPLKKNKSGSNIDR